MAQKSRLAFNSALAIRAEQVSFATRKLSNIKPSAKAIRSHLSFPFIQPDVSMWVMSEPF